MDHFLNILASDEKKRSDSVLWQKSQYEQKCKKAKWQDKKRHNKLDETAITDRLRTVSWINHIKQTGVINWLTGKTFPLPAAM